MRRVLAAIVACLATAAPAAGPAPHAGAAPAATRVEAYFTPGDDVAGVIARRIAQARRTVQVQAYLFTHRGIASALAGAARRGVTVELVGDARQHEAGGLPVVKSLARAGVGVWLSGDYAAFHNKVVLVDALTPAAVVVTGSYNFTKAAQEKNAENVVVISGSPEVALRFARDFERHRDRSSRLQ